MWESQTKAIQTNNNQIYKSNRKKKIKKAVAQKNQKAVALKAL
jgi:hypothetical protein